MINKIMTICNFIFSSNLLCISRSSYVSIELSSVFLAQKSILYYGTNISSTAEIDKSEHL